MRKFQSYKRGQSSRTKRLLITALVGVLLLGGLSLLDAANVIDIPGFADKKPASTNDPNKINYGPPTEEEKKETEAFKEKQTSGNAAPTVTKPASGQKAAVTPVLSSWGQNSSTKALEGTGYVPGIIESGGTCTLTAAKGGQKVSESIVATPNAQNVSCGLITIARSRLTEGTWSLTMSYSSAAAEGTSQPRFQEVN